MPGLIGLVYDHPDVTASPRSRRQLHAEDTRRAIIANARQQFGTSGFTNASLKAIALDAGVTIGAVYHHFTSKAQLFDEVFVDVEADLLAVSLAAAQRRPGAPLTERLLCSFDAYLTAIEDPALRRIVLIDAPAVLGVERCEDVFDTFGRSGIRSALVQAGKDGASVVGGVDVAARLIFGALVAATGPGSGPRGRLARRDIMDGLAALLRAVVGPGSSGPDPAGTCEPS
jgi:AcrR family transcriptional regulator